MPITPEDVADAVRQWCTAWHTRDIPTILAMEVQAGGFGFRRVDRRDHVAIGEAPYRRTLEQFFGRMDDYRLEPEDIQSAVTGEVGLAWGVYIETFQEQGRPPGRARIRFSKALTKGPHGWQVLLYHRDIQPFAEDGRYPEDADGRVAHALRGHRGRGDSGTDRGICATAVGVCRYKVGFIPHWRKGNYDEV